MPRLFLLSTTVDPPDAPNYGSKRSGYAPTFYHCYALSDCELTRRTGNRPHTSIDILDDDSLLNIFYLSRPLLLNKAEKNPARILEGGDWNRERWWYKFTQVCRRWRYLTLASASHLGLSLVCTRGTPVAKMLAHSPPLPLIIDHLGKDRDITSEDKKGVLLALQHRDRVRRIRLRFPFASLRKLIVAMDGEFPKLEYLYIEPASTHDSGLKLPDKFRAPRLRHLVLRGFASLIWGRLSTISVNHDLVTLSLQDVHQSTYFSPNHLLQRLLDMSQLETLGITFQRLIPDSDFGIQLPHMPVTTHVTLPNLRWFAFGGRSAYSEALLPYMRAPVLEKLQLLFDYQPSFSVPYLLDFMRTTETVRLTSVRFCFHLSGVSVWGYPREGVRTETFYLRVGCEDLYKQVASVVQIFNALGTVISVVDHLTLEFLRYPISPTTNNRTDATEWRNLLRLFSNVKTLHIDDDFREQISGALVLDNGESPTDLFPELRVLKYTVIRVPNYTFHAFADARESTGRPVTLVHC